MNKKENETYKYNVAQLAAHQTLHDTIKNAAPAPGHIVGGVIGVVLFIDPETGEGRMAPFSTVLEAIEDGLPDIMMDAASELIDRADEMRGGPSPVEASLLATLQNAVAEQGVLDAFPPLAQGRSQLPS
jgi:hypothetical protein